MVLGKLLIEGIPSYKTYTNMPGYDVVATNPEKNLSAKIQVKSRWKTGAEGFLIKNFDCDFVVVVKLNRGSKEGKAKILPPNYYIFPVNFVKKLPRTKGWGKINFSKIPDLESYSDKWDLIRKFLKL